MSTTHLGNCDAALLGQLLFSLLAGIRVAEVRVEILVQNFRRLLAEVSPFPPEWGAKREKGRASPLMGTSINSSIWIAQIAQSISHINGENNEEWALRALGSGIYRVLLQESRQHTEDQTPTNKLTSPHTHTNKHSHKTHTMFNLVCWSPISSPSV